METVMHRLYTHENKRTFYKYHKIIYLKQKLLTERAGEVLFAFYHSLTWHFKMANV